MISIWDVILVSETDFNQPNNCFPKVKPKLEKQGKFAKIIGNLGMNYFGLCSDTNGFPQ